MNSQNHQDQPATATRMRWGALAAIAIAQLMVVLDVTVMNIALPTTQEALGFSDVGRQWVIAAYGLTFGSLLLVGGRINDRWGRRRSFLLGLAGFALASALGGFAVNLEMLVASRALQGVFGALLAPAALSLLTTSFPEGRDRARAFGVFGAVGASGGAIGLLLGGALTQYASWRWTLLINIAFAVAAAWLGATNIRDNDEHQRTRIDYRGAILATAGLALLVGSLSSAELNGWLAPTTVALLVAAITVLVGFVTAQHHSPAPLLPLRLVTDRNRGGALLSYAVAIMAQLGLFLMLSYFLQQQLGFGPMLAGLAFMPLTLGLLAGATQVAPRLLHRAGARVLIGGGFATAAVGIALLTRIGITANYWTDIMPGTILLGVGSGIAITVGQSVATSNVAHSDTGVISATVNVASQVGAALGTALLSTIHTVSTTTWIDTHPTSPSVDATMHGYTVTITAAAILMGLAALIATTLVNHPTVTDREREGADTPLDFAMEPA